jgi:L-fucose isomerase-like protein
MYFEFITAASEFSNSDEAVQGIVGRYIDGLQNVGGKKITADHIGTDAPLFYFVVTGGVENLVLTLQKKRNAAVIDEPVFLLAHPANNSLPAAMEILARLQQDGTKGRIFYISSPDDSHTLGEVAQSVHDLEVYRTMHKTRLGAVGMPSDWLVASSPAHGIIKSKWGPELIPVPLNKVLSLMKTANAREVQTAANNLSDGAVSIVEPSPEHIESAVSVYLALKQIISDYKLDSLTVRCFDIVMQTQTTGCFALSELTDEGIIAGCEGDIMSVVGMLWAKTLLSVIPWMANPSRLNEHENKLWLAHCTIPRKMIQDYTLRSHFESGLGVGIQGTVPLGPVTLLRVGGRNMDKLWLSEGSLLQNGTEDNLCRTQVEIQLERGGTVTDLLKAPLGNHIVVLLGHHMDRLQSWWETMAN